jgi:hypothetical protein
VTYGKHLNELGVVELYLFSTSHRSFEPEAESQCGAYMNIALQLDPDSPEALQCLASVRISQNRQAEAQGLVQRAWQLWQEASEGNNAFHPH